MRVEGWEDAPRQLRHEWPSGVSSVASKCLSCAACHRRWRAYQEGAGRLSKRTLFRSNSKDKARAKPGKYRCNFAILHGRIVTSVCSRGGKGTHGGAAPWLTLIVHIRGGHLRL